MSVSLEITEGTQAIPSAGGNVVARVGNSSAGDDNSVTEWDAGSDGLVASVLGYGTLTEDTARALRITSQRTIAVKAHASIAAVLGEVVARNALDDDDATGPVIAVSGTPTFSFLLRLRIVAGGALGVARGRIALDGYTYGPEVILEAPLPAAVRGTVNLIGVNLDTLLHGKTIIATIDGGSAATATFDHPTTFADVIEQLDDEGIPARIVAGKYLELRGVVLGAAGSLDIGTGTANDELGFATNPGLVNGTDSDLEVPKTGVTLEFTAGDYVEGETYTVQTTEARFTIADMNTALDALRASGVVFGKVFVDQVPADGADERAFGDALDAKLSSWHNAAGDRIFPLWVMPSALGEPDAISANDTDVRTAMSGHTSLLSAGIGHGDMYCTGSEFVGSFRRSLAVPLCERFAAERLSADPGNGSFKALAQCSMIGPDGVTTARDELTAVVKMETHGFITATRKNKLPFIKAGATRAGNTSKFFFPGVLSMAMLATHTVYQRARQYENRDERLAPDGSLREPIAVAFERVFDTDLTTAVVDDDHASAVKTTVDRTKRALPNGVYPLTITWQVQMKGQIRDVKGTLSVVTELELA